MNRCAQNLVKHVKHALKAFKYSGVGLFDTFKHETAFQQETAALILLPVLAKILGASSGSLLLIIGAWLVVMLAETLNSAIENLCNLVSPEYHILVKRAKDAASASVLLAILGNICLWIYLAALAT
ncbi:MAG: diacylglycerol kinase [Deltaproteobacteria bacterium]|jgi:diacylglycerol kinase (ATP)|nr:diacylglycerol kinase [Deltaproteobacteria bacterium]